jgi:hypothetical protein
MKNKVSEKPDLDLSLRLAIIIRLGWKSLSATSILAYYKHSQITAKESFIILEPDPDARLAAGSSGSSLLLFLALDEHRTL